jgi:hypothetical protein
MATTRRRRRQRLPPTWVRRATWVHHPETGNTEFLFPALSPKAEDDELDRLHAWASSDTNAKILGTWMARIARWQTLGPCQCPQCVADRGVNA